MSDKATNIWGKRYTVSRIGRIHFVHFKSRTKAIEFALDSKESDGGDWLVAEYDRLGRSKVAFRTDRC